MKINFLAWRVGMKVRYVLGYIIGAAILAAIYIIVMNRIFL